MKNIHILPTDKPSRLIIHSTLLNEFRLLDKPIEDWKHKKNIYITSDEEIKASVYCLINKVLCKTELLEGRIVSRQLSGGGTMDICKTEYLEIILTTDQDLIKDGVQSIDDEFLECFVKNPSCESVEIKTFIKTYEDGYSFDKLEYKIIIPKEEPKQRLEKYSERFDNDKSPIGNPDTWDKRIVEEPKQETLEEAALNYSIYNEQINKAVQEAVKFGAKWKQEPNKNKYSEEDMKIAFDSNIKDWISFEEFIEQFKKK
jgi:hypothetical protein